MPANFVLVGDCGGTNTRLSLISIPENAEDPPRGCRAPGEKVLEQRFRNDRYISFVEIVRIFLADARSKLKDCQVIRTACLACAGPIIDQTCSFTNVERGWVIDAQLLQTELEIPLVYLCNDFEAMGHGLWCIADFECHVLQDVPAAPGGVMATIGAGTGLGETFLTLDPEGGHYICWPSEGGHVDWSPKTDEEAELLDFLRHKFAHKRRVSVERVVSGSGLANIYEYLSTKHSDRVNPAVHQEIANAGSAKGGVISKHSEDDGLCRRAMEIMFCAYASECGCAMLKWLPTGGCAF